MSFSADLRTFFLNIPAISAQIGTRLFPYVIDQSAVGIYPSAIYQLSLPIPSKDISVVNQKHWETDLVIAVSARDTATQSGHDVALGVCGLFKDAIDCYIGQIGNWHIKWVKFDHGHMEYEAEPTTYVQVAAFTIYTLEQPNFLT